MGSSTDGHGSTLRWLAPILLLLVSALLALAPSLITTHITPLLLRWDEAAATLEGPGQRLSPSGVVLLRRCQANLRGNDTSAADPGPTDGSNGGRKPSAGAQAVAGEGTEVGAGADKGEAREERGHTDQQGPAGEWLHWDVPTLPFSLSSQHSDFGWVQTRGLGTHESSVGVRTCFTIAVMTRSGQAFDRGCLQRAAFLANMSSVEAVQGLTGRRDRTKR